MAKNPQPGATPLKAFTQHQWTARNPLYGCPHGAVIATLRAFAYQWQYRASGARNLRCLSRHRQNTRHWTFIDLGVIGAGRILRIGPSEITKMDSPFRRNADKTNY